MRVLVTGSRGKVGRATVQALVDAGHDVLGVDLVRPVFDAGVVVPGRYQMADLTDAGSAFSVVAGVGRGRAHRRHPAADRATRPTSCSRPT